MNSSEAYSKLGLAPNSSDKDIDAAFRKLAAKLHPDVNKAETAEQDFKDLNEAYQFLKKHHGNQPNLEDILSEFKRQVQESFGFVRQPNGNKRIYASINIPFVDSVIGCVKPIKYSRKVACTACVGTGRVQKDISTECKKCHGAGSRQYDGKTLPCTTCKGTGKIPVTEVCSKCNGVPIIDMKFESRVIIPPGIRNGEMLIISKKGDISQFGNYDDARIMVTVEADPEFRTIGNNIGSFVKISLLEALQGTTKKVRTVKGIKTLKIPGPRKHGDQIEADGLGYPPNGKHVFILDVEYPQNINGLVQFLGESNADGYIDNDSSTLNGAE